MPKNLLNIDNLSKIAKAKHIKENNVTRHSDKPEIHIINASEDEYADENIEYEQDEDYEFDDQNKCLNEESDEDEDDDIFKET